MATTWIDIADSAVKIGLGAAIAGIVAVAAPFAAFAKEVFIDRRHRRLRQLEECAAHLETYLNYLSNRAGASLDYYNAYSAGKIPDSTQKRFDRLIGQIDERSADKDIATARLELLGIHDVADEIRELSDQLLVKMRSLHEPISPPDRLTRLKELRAQLFTERRAILRKIGALYALEPELRKATRFDFDVI